jgi:hypothetical protein
MPDKFENNRSIAGTIRPEFGLLFQYVVFSQDVCPDNTHSYLIRLNFFNPPRSMISLISFTSSLNRALDPRE